MNLLTDLILKKYKTKYNSESKIVISNIKINNNEDYKIINPKIGDKKKLLDLAKKNIEELKHELKIKETMLIDKKKIIKNLQQKLHLKRIPNHIECFDNSNLCGTNPVSSCVVFKNGEPSKNDYRHFKVKTIVGPDDFKTMEEIISRRYVNNTILPDLIIVDGGLGQLHSAVKVLKKLNILEKLDVLGLAKEFEDIYYPNGEKINLEDNSEELKLIQFIRDEAHRFAINFHRRLRSKNFFKKIQ